MEYPGFRSETSDLQQSERKHLVAENVRLRSENAELRSMVASLDRQIRCIQSDHESTLHCISAPGKSCMDISTNSECKKDVEESPCQDPKYIKHCQRLAGEIAFQLDQRILGYIFQGQNCLYGMSMSDIENKILQMTTCPVTKKVNEKLKCELFDRYVQIMCKLKKLHYNPAIHSSLSEKMVNQFGLMKERPAPGSSEYAQYSDPKILCNMLTAAVKCDTMSDAHILLSCLLALAEEDGEPIFNWCDRGRTFCARAPTTAPLH